MDTIFGRAESINPNLLAERMMRQSFRKGRFGQFVGGDIYKPKKDDVGSLGRLNPAFSGKPIDVFDKFVTVGHTKMLIPVKLRLTGMPHHGDTNPVGRAEAYRVAYREVEINQTGKTLSLPVGMSAQITKQYAQELILSANADLTEWNSNYWGLGNYNLAMLAGYTRDLVAPTTQKGVGKSYVSHPNLFTAQGGQVTYAGGRPGTAAYEAAVAAALNGLANTSSDYMSPAVIRAMVAEAQRKKIAPVEFEKGMELYPIFLKDSQWIQLSNHPDFKEKFQRVMIEVAKNPLFNGAYAITDGAVIYPDKELWCAYTTADDANVTADTVEYGPRPTAAERSLGYKLGNYIENPDTGNKAGAVLLGAAALSVGIGERLKFTEYEGPHGSSREIGVQYIISGCRNDVYDTDGKITGTANNFYENTSSLVCFTYSPYALAW